MTVQDTTRRAGPYAGTGAQTDFPFAFKTFAGEDVRVVQSVGGVESDVAPSSYLVTLNANQETSPGGVVSFYTAPSASTTLVLVSGLDYDQPMALPSGGNFPPRSIEQQLDRVAMQLQQLRDLLARAATAPETGTAIDPSLPVPSALSLLGWNAEGTALENVDPQSLVNLSLSPTNVDSTDQNLIDWFFKVPGLAPGLSVRNSTAGTTVTSSGTGTRIGNVTHAELYTQVTALSAAGGGVRLEGLPYVATKGTPLVAEVTNPLAAAVSATFRAEAIPASQSVLLQKFDTDDASWLPVTDYDIGVGTQVNVAGTYTVQTASPTTPPLVSCPPYYWKSSNLTALVDSVSGGVIYAVRRVDAPDFAGWVATTRASNVILRSTDLVNWSAYTIPSGWGVGYVYDLQYAGGYWVVRVGSSLLVSATLAGAWTLVTFSGGPANPLVSCYEFINGRWFMCGTNGAIYKAPADPTTAWVWKWTSGPGSSAYMRAIAAVGTTIVAMGTGSWSAKSTDDGETFSNNTLSGLPFTDITAQGLISDNGEFIMASGQYIAASSNGTAWTTRQNMSLTSSPYYNWVTGALNITSAGGYCLMTHTGGYGDNGLVYSADGFRTLKRRRFQPSTGARLAAYPITYGNGFWHFAIGGDGLGSTREVFFARQLM